MLSFGKRGILLDGVKSGSMWVWKAFRRRQLTVSRFCLHFLSSSSYCLCEDGFFENVRRDVAGVLLQNGFGVKVFICPKRN